MVKPGLAECVIHNHTYPHKLCENVFLPALLDNIICEMKQPSNQAGQVILMVLPLVVSLFSHRVAFSNTKLEVFFDNKIPSCCLPPAPFCPPICSDAFTERNRGNRGQDSSPILEMEKLRSTYDCRDWKRFYNYFRKNRPHRKEASIIFFNHWSYYNPIQAQVVNNCSGFPFNILVKVQKKKKECGQSSQCILLLSVLEISNGYSDEPHFVFDLFHLYFNWWPSEYSNLCFSQKKSIVECCTSLYYMK